MRDSTQQWVDKAEGDFRSMVRESSVAQNPNYDIVCFLSQQCVEKLLKAIMIEEETDFPKTHDLQKLLRLLTDRHPELEVLLPSLTKLSRLGADVRYPYESAGQMEAEFAKAACVEGRETILQTLGISPSSQP
jgi:HEPN domain-containing protein